MLKWFFCKITLMKSHFKMSNTQAIETRAQEFNWSQGIGKIWFILDVFTKIKHENANHTAINTIIISALYIKPNYISKRVRAFMLITWKSLAFTVGNKQNKVKTEWHGACTIPCGTIMFYHHKQSHDTQINKQLFALWSHTMPRGIHSFKRITQIHWDSFKINKCPEVPLNKI